MAAKTLRELALSITAKFADFKKSSQEVANETAKMKKSAKTASDGFKGLGSTLKDALDNAIPGLSSATSGIKDFTSNIYKSISGIGGAAKAMKVLKIAFASLGIPALIMAIVSLLSYFTKTEKGGDLVAKVFGGIKAVVSTVLKTLGAFGEALVKLFQGDFKGAWETAKGAVKGFGQEVVNAYKTGADAADRLDKLEEDRVAFMVREQELLNQIAKAREIISDSEASVADKQKAYANAVAAENELYAKRKAFAQEDLDIFLQLSKTKERTTELTQEENEKRIAVLALDEEHSQNMKALNREYRRVVKEAEDEKKELEKASAAAKKMINYQKEVEFYTGKIANLERDIARNRQIMDDTEQSLVVRIKAANDVLNETNEYYRLRISYQEAVTRAAEDSYNQDQDNLDLYQDMVKQQKDLKQLKEDQIDETKKLQENISLNTYEYEKQTKEKKDQVQITRVLSDLEKQVIEDIQGQQDEIRKVKEKFDQLYGTADNFTAPQLWNRMRDQIQVSGEKILILNSAFDKAYNNQETGLGKLYQNYASLRTAIEKATTTIKDFSIIPGSIVPIPNIVAGIKLPELDQIKNNIVEINTAMIDLALSKSIGEIVAGRGTKEDLEIVSSKVAKMQELIDKVRGGGEVATPSSFEQILPPLEGFDGYMSYIKTSWKDAWAEMAAESVNVASMLQSGLVNTIGAITTAFSNLFSDQKKGWKGIVTAALGAIQQIVNALLAQAIASMIAKESSKGIIGLALAAVGVAGLIAVWNNLVPEFAEGAYVTKPTYAMIGERGPEWVLNRGQMASLLSARGGPVEVAGYVRVSGQDLLIAINNAEKFKGSY